MNKKRILCLEVLRTNGGYRRKADLRNISPSPVVSQNIVYIKKQRNKRLERDDTMAVTTQRRNNAFVVKPSMFEKFKKESNKKDIDNIYAIASKFENNIEKLRRK